MATVAPKVAIVHDWLTTMGGAEKVVLALHEAFPSAPIFTSTYIPENVPDFNGLDVRTTSLQKLPKVVRRFHKLLPSMRTKAFTKLDLSEYDIIISSSSAEAKQVRKTRPGQLHICYCHTPIRYYWSHYDEYKKADGFGALKPAVRALVPLMVPAQRKADYEAAQNVDVFIANSSEVQERIKKYYGRNSIVVNPPVDTKRFTPSQTRENFYVALGRQVPYKRIDLAVAAATKLGVALKVFGNGSEHEKLVAQAGKTVKFYSDRHGNASDKAVTNALNRAKGFLFPTDEDFGIVQAEALAGGTPVIAYGKGGALDIVTDGETGVLFHEQTVDGLTEAITRAESINFKPVLLAQRAKRFDKGLFITKMKKIVADEYSKNLDSLR